MRTLSHIIINARAKIHFLTDTPNPIVSAISLSIVVRVAVVQVHVPTVVGIVRVGSS